MKTTLLLCALLLDSFFSATAQTQIVNSQALAKRITTIVSNIKPGEMVLIFDGKDQLDLMET